MRRPPGKEEAVPVHTVDELLLAHYEKGCNRICKEMTWLASASKFDLYPSTKLAEHGHSMTLPHLGA